MVKVEVKCSYEQIYRYITTVMCEGLDSSHNSLYVVSADDGLSDGGEFELPQIIALDVEEAPALRIMIYVLCRTLPAVVEVDDAPPFEVELRVSRQGVVLYDRAYLVNQWGGLTVDVVL